MSYLEELVKQSIIDIIPEKQQNKMIIRELEHQMGSYDVKHVIETAIEKQVKTAVAEYIDEHPEAFDGIDKVVAEEFDKELKDYSTIRRVVKKFISKATWRYYIERYLY